MSACSPSGKDSNHEKSRKIERGFFGTALKKIPIDSIIGNWETTNIHFREYATNGTISRSYINKSDRINLEFTSDKKLLMNQDTIGICLKKIII